MLQWQEHVHREGLYPESEVGVGKELVVGGQMGGEYRRKRLREPAWLRFGVRVITFGFVDVGG